MKTLAALATIIGLMGFATTASAYACNWGNSSQNAESTVLPPADATGT